MNWQWTPYTVPLIVAAVISIVAALYVMWQRYHSIRARVGVLLLLCGAVWMLGAALELSSVDLAAKIVWDKLQFLGICIIPTAWLAYTLRYTGRDKWMTHRTRVLLSVVPFITFVLVITNEAHGLIWTDSWLDTSGSFVTKRAPYGVGLWAYMVYSYVLILIGVFFVFQALVHSGRLYRWQAGALLVAVAMPWLFNVGEHIFGWVFLRDVELTPFALAVTVPIIAWSFYRLQVRDIVPVARGAILESMVDAVIVLDASDLIVDFNPAAQRLIGHRGLQVIGQPLGEIWHEGLSLLERSHDRVEGSNEIVLRVDSGLRTYDFRVSSLLDWRGQLVSRVVVLRDITELKRRTSELATLLEAGKAVSSTLDLEEVLSRIAQQMGRAIDVTSAYISGYEPETKVARVLAEYISPQACPAEQVSDLGVAYAEEAEAEWLEMMQAGQHDIIHIDDANITEFEREHMQQYGAQTILYIPLRMKGELVGYAELWESRRRREYTPEEIGLCCDIAQQAAIALENARLYEQAQQEIEERGRAEEVLRAREWYVTLLNDITRAALETPDLPTMLQTLADRLGELFEADGCYLTLWDEETRTTVPCAAYGEAREIYPSLRPEPGEMTMTESVLRAGHPLVVEDVFNTSYLSRRIAELFPDRSLLGLPLIAGERKLGAALIAFNEPHHFTADEITRGQQVSGQIALAVAKARLLEETEARWREAETLRQAGAVLTETLSLAETLARILQQLESVVPYDTASVQLLQEDHVEVVSGRGFPDISAVIGLKFPVPGDNLNTIIVQEREPLLFADVQASHPEYFGPPHDYIRSWLAVPLIVHDRLIGILTVDSVQPGYFTQDHVRLVTPLANQAAIAIENARLHEELQMRADELEWRVEERTAELRAEQEKSEAILRSVGDAIAVTDTEMHMQYVNDAFTALTGYTATEALGQPVFDLVAREVPERSERVMPLALVEGHSWLGEVVIQRKDGRTYDAALTIAPVRDAEGHLVGYVSSHRDISRLRELDRARSQFIANVSHQLRTPVANMKLYTQLLRMGRRPEKADHYLRVIEEQTDRLKELIQDILKMTALDSGQAVTAWGPISLSTVVGDVVTRFQSRAHGSGLTLSSAPVPPHLPQVNGDQVQLVQALAELVDNAIVFTPAGGQVIVEVKTAEEEGQNWVTIAVRDTGPGIPTEEQERIFDRFFRGRLAESGNVPGTGLGLSIVEEIMRAHGGWVTVESEVGQGSTFTLWLSSVPDPGARP